MPDYTVMIRNNDFGTPPVHSGTQSIKKINIVDDPRIRRCSSTINGKTYGTVLISRLFELSLMVL
ncbi:hypothetical protein EYZ11_006872 [Aspergillus tanneri]|uniref:Uncharacterized protein n=1 Tax=Aspergillus tanneri TaxID=1220188 RepID=A0A4S3JER6_9EURO|nr:hypothetical protein EYZ11_006872 [Aspergillus tanneri]